MKSLLRILLIEDHEDDIEVFDRAFARANVPCRLTFARNGIEAFNILNGYRPAEYPDIILLDIDLPDMSGTAFLERCRATDGLKMIPVVILTSSSRPTDICDCYERYASAYFVKPFGVSEYIDMIEKILAYWSCAARPTLTLCPEHVNSPS